MNTFELRFPQEIPYTAIRAPDFVAAVTAFRAHRKLDTCCIFQVVLRGHIDDSRYDVLVWDGVCTPRQTS